MKTMLSIRSLLLFLFISNLFIFNAQVQQQTHSCGFDHVHKEQLLNNELYRIKTEQFNEFVQNFSYDSRSGATPKIPVVVHVMETGNSLTQISDAQIQNAIKELNEMFRKVAGSKGDGDGVDVGIEFVLAVRDPNGNCTNGINRFDMTGVGTYMSNGVYRQSSGVSDATLKSYISWDQSKYYNIWAVSEIDNNNGGAGVQGYAYFASSHGSSEDGTVILVNALKSSGNTTLSHELGHAFNLFHTFEGDDTNNDGVADVCPPNTNCSIQGDLVCDTPPHQRSPSDCNTTGVNSCDGNSSNLLFVRNYMDYSSSACQNMFTAGQKTRMQAALTTRASFLQENGNMALVPTNDVVVDFTASKQLLCGVGQSVQFYDFSSCIPNTFLSDSEFNDITFEWTVTNGTNTYTATTQNPSITFAHSGTFNVTLEVTTLSGVFSLTKQGLVVVAASPRVSCTPTSFNPSNNYGFTVNRVQLNTIDKSTSTGVNGVYQDFSCTDNTVISSTGTHSISVTIRSSNGTNSEFFEAYIDFNNDGAFTHPDELIGSGSVLNNTSTVNSNFSVPVGAVKNTLLRMRVIGDIGSINNNKRTCVFESLSVGDVEDYGVYISDNVASVTIAASPSNSITYGANVTFTATPTNGGASPTYAWYVNGELQSGQTSGTYSNTTLLDGDEVYCKLISNLPGVINSPAQSNTISMTVVGPPISDFSANLVAVCQGSSIQFTDESLLLPTGWSWSFPGGTASSLSVQNPTVTYSTPGVYAVTLTTTNDEGTGTTETKTGYITVYESPRTTCDVTRSTAPAAGIGITNVKLNTINHNTVYDGSTVNNYSCSQMTTLQTSTSYTVSVSVGSSNDQWVRAYIDYNNNGDFTDPGELVFSPATGRGVRSGSFTTPANPTLNTLLKMRVISDFVNTSPGSCTSPLQYGQVEEYGIVIQAPCTAPIVDATAPSARCGVGSLTISATPSLGATIKWYTQATGGTAIVDDADYDFSGNSLIINNLTLTTIFYAEADNGGCVSASRTAVTATVNTCTTKLNTASCGSLLANTNSPIYCKKVVGATNYRYIIQHAPTGFYRTLTRNSADTMYKFSWIGLPENSGYTYSVRVSAYVNNAWQPFGETCQVTVLNAEPKLAVGSCGVNLTNLNKPLYCTVVQGATNYRYIIRNVATGYYRTFTKGSADNSFLLNFNDIQYNTTYTITVSAFVGGRWSTYGNPCNVTTPTKEPKLEDPWCNSILSSNTQFSFELIPGAVEYSLIIQNTSGFYRTIFNGPTNGRYFKLSWIGIPNNGLTYQIRIAYKTADGIWSPYGQPCTIETTNLGGITQNEDGIANFGEEQYLTVFPNPNNGTFTASASKPGDFVLLNSLGQIIQHITLTEENLKIEITKVSSGMYFLSGTVDGQQLVEKIVVE